MRDKQDLSGAFADTEDKLTQTSAPQAHDYMDCLKDESYKSLSEAEKIELLESLFIIMKSFVNLGYGLDPVNKLVAEFENSNEEPVPVIECEDATNEER
ncbi:MAG: hypothetical protein JKY46_08575 [Robiginitomaculum sp.]|nr:hypothetical protein [Robiginitomaculum sp.]